MTFGQLVSKPDDTLNLFWKLQPRRWLFKNCCGNFGLQYHMTKTQNSQLILRQKYYRFCILKLMNENKCILFDGFFSNSWIVQDSKKNLLRKLNVNAKSEKNKQIFKRNNHSLARRTLAFCWKIFWPNVDKWRWLNVILLIGST